MQQFWRKKSDIEWRRPIVPIHEIAETVRDREFLEKLPVNQRFLSNNMNQMIFAAPNYQIGNPRRQNRPKIHSYPKGISIVESTRRFGLEAKPQ